MLSSGIDRIQSMFIRGQPTSAHDEPSMIEFSHEGARLAVLRSYRDITIYQFPSLNVVSKWSIESGVDRKPGIAFDPFDSNAFWTSDIGFTKWRLDNGKQILRLGRADERGIYFSRSRPLVASPSSGHVWDARSGIELARFYHVGAQTLWFDDRNSFRTASPSEVRSWGLARTTPYGIGDVDTAALSEDNKVGVIGGYHNLALLSIQDAKATTLLNPSDSGFAVALDRRGELAAANNGGQLIVWRLNTGVPTVAWSKDTHSSELYFTHDGKYLLSCENTPFQSGFLIGDRYESHSGNKVGGFGGRFVDQCLGFTPDDSGVLIWKPGTGLAVVKAEDGSEKPFEIQPKVRPTIRFSVDGGYMYTVENQPENSTTQSTLRVWNLRSRQEVKSLAFSFEVVDFAVSPSGKHIAAAGDDQTVRVYDLHSGEELIRYREAVPVRRVVFSTGGQSLLIIDQKSFHIQPWQDLDLLRNICDRVTRNLRPDEWKHYQINRPFFKACPSLP